MRPGLEILSYVHSEYPVPTRMDETICIQDINVLICFVQCILSLQRLALFILCIFILHEVVTL